MLVEGDMGDHCAYAIVDKVNRVDVCDSNAANSVDDGVEFVRGVGVKGEGAGGHHTEVSSSAFSWMGSVLGK